ncbi:MAG: hypothetical protein MHMPM18_000948 [Marteilia pararefringens]
MNWKEEEKVLKYIEQLKFYPSSSHTDIRDFVSIFTIDNISRRQKLFYHNNASSQICASLLDFQYRDNMLMYCNDDNVIMLAEIQEIEGKKCLAKSSIGLSLDHKPLDLKWLPHDSEMFLLLDCGFLKLYDIFSQKICSSFATGRMNNFDISDNCNRPQIVAAFYNESQIKIIDIISRSTSVINFDTNFNIQQVFFLSNEPNFIVFRDSKVVYTIDQRMTTKLFSKIDSTLLAPRGKPNVHSHINDMLKDPILPNIGIIVSSSVSHVHTLDGISSKLLYSTDNPSNCFGFASSLYFSRLFFYDEKRLGIFYTNLDNESPSIELYSNHRQKPINVTRIIPLNDISPHCICIMDSDLIEII